MLAQVDSTITFTVLAIFAGIMTVAALIMACLLVMISRAAHDLRQSAHQMAQGDLSQRVSVRGPLQLTGLSEALNKMARQLQDRLSTVVQQRNELGAVLSSMAEGVIAIDTDEQVLSLNRAAARLLDLDAAEVIDRSIQETVRHRALQDFVASTLSEGRPMQTQLTLRRYGQHGSDDRYIQAQSALLRNAAGQRIGAVIVLHDVSQVHRLEGIRRDFVANVSHEVKTPVAAIKAAIETVLDETDIENDHRARFMQIVVRQADRLDAIVDDLLSLARIEQGRDEIVGHLEALPVRPILAEAIETCHAKAGAKSIQIELACDSQLSCRADPVLLGQAMTNLVDNAIKYSDPETSVTVSGKVEQGELVLQVADQGRGIEPVHLTRIFERFYRTDKARSRQLGGTGLGLSIVKHIAEAHGGRVGVDSRPGQGSTFRILLPRLSPQTNDGADSQDDQPSPASVDPNEPSKS